jgi:hypothetical protein
MDGYSIENQSGVEGCFFVERGFGVCEKPALAAWFDNKSFDKRPTQNAKQEDLKMSSQKLKETMQSSHKKALVCCTRVFGKGSLRDKIQMLECFSHYFGVRLQRPGIASLPTLPVHPDQTPAKTRNAIVARGH